MNKIILNFLLIAFLLITNIFGIYDDVIKSNTYPMSPVVTLIVSIILFILVIPLYFFHKKNQKKWEKITCYFMLLLLFFMFLNDFMPLTNIVTQWNTHKEEMKEAFIHGAVAYLFGIVTSCIYFWLTKRKETEPVFDWLLKIAFGFVLFMALNNFPFSPPLTGIYCLLGSFVGSELINYWFDNRKL